MENFLFPNFVLQISSSNSATSSVRLVIRKRPFLCSKPWWILHFLNPTASKNWPPSSRYTSAIKQLMWYRRYLTLITPKLKDCVIQIVFLAFYMLNWNYFGKWSRWFYWCVIVQAEFFEPFWDSGEARVGEIGARGWKMWMLQQERGGWIQPSEGKSQPLHSLNIVNPYSLTDF